MAQDSAGTIDEYDRGCEAAVTEMTRDSSGNHRILKTYTLEDILPHGS